jgi:hypothetical protein
VKEKENKNYFTKDNNKKSKNSKMNTGDEKLQAEKRCSKD